MWHSGAHGDTMWHNTNTRTFASTAWRTTQRQCERAIDDSCAAQRLAVAHIEDAKPAGVRDLHKAGVRRCVLMALPRLCGVCCMALCYTLECVQRRAHAAQLCVRASSGSEPSGRRSQCSRASASSVRSVRLAQHDKFKSVSPVHLLATATTPTSVTRAQHRKFRCVSAVSRSESVSCTRTGADRCDVRGGATRRPQGG